MGQFVRRFLVEQKDGGWRVRSAKSQGGSTGRCTPAGE
jgi:hypothetical protein